MHVSGKQACSCTSKGRVLLGHCSCTAVKFTCEAAWWYLVGWWQHSCPRHSNGQAYGKHSVVCHCYLPRDRFWLNVNFILPYQELASKSGSSVMCSVRGIACLSLCCCLVPVCYFRMAHAVAACLAAYTSWLWKLPPVWIFLRQEDDQTWQQYVKGIAPAGNKAENVVSMPGKYVHRILCVLNATR